MIKKKRILSEISGALDVAFTSVFLYAVLAFTCLEK